MTSFDPGFETHGTTEQAGARGRMVPARVGAWHFVVLVPFAVTQPDYSLFANPA
jgi:hypothetical protein